MLERDIGNRIRSIRSDRGLRLADLASTTGFSPGQLSKIECGKVSSPISTLELIARALEVNLEQLLSDGAQTDNLPKPKEISIVKKGEGLHHYVGGEGGVSTWEWLAPEKENKLIEPFIVTEPSGHLPSIFSHHPGQEMVFVLQGKMQFGFRKEKYVLSEGDCVYFDASVAHMVRNIGDGDLRYLVVRSAF